MGDTIQHIPVPIPSQDKFGGLWQEGIRHKIGDWWRWIAD